MKRLNGLTVVKVGTQVVCTPQGVPDQDFLAELGGQIKLCATPRRRFVIVLSGAIGAGMEQLKLEARPRSVSQRQVCAAIGQGRLMEMVRRAFTAHDLTVAQVLLAKDTLRNPTSRGNALRTLNKLIRLGVVPVLNENDAVATFEIEDNFGDNDFLSAEVAVQMQARHLVMLTSADGVWHDGQLLKKINAEKMPRIKNLGSSRLGTGGIRNKLKAARYAAKAGITVTLANGRTANILPLIAEGKAVCTQVTKIN